jgi:hypothetical protein
MAELQRPSGPDSLPHFPQPVQRAVVFLCGSTEQLCSKLWWPEVAVSVLWQYSVIGAGQHRIVYIDI